MNKNPGLLCSAYAERRLRQNGGRGNHEHNKLRFSFKSLSGWFRAGIIVVGNKNTKKYNLYIYEKQNRMSDTRGETFVTNVQKKHLHNLSIVRKIDLAPVGEVGEFCYTCEV